MRILYKYPEKLKAGDKVRSFLSGEPEKVYTIEKVWYAGEGHSSSGWLAVVPELHTVTTDVDAVWCIPVGTTIEDLVFFENQYRYSSEEIDDMREGIYASSP